MAIGLFIANKLGVKYTIDWEDSDRAQRVDSNKISKSVEASEPLVDTL